MTGTMQHPCGCVNEIDQRCGAIKSLLKCGIHKAMQRAPEDLGEDYYRELGKPDPGFIPPHVAEFEECFGKLPRPETENDWALEIGAGASRYVPMITDAGWKYAAVEPSPWARRWISEQYGDRFIQTTGSTWEMYASDVDCLLGDRGGTIYPDRSWSWKYGMILAAHSLEHMRDAPEMIQKMSDFLIPGGMLFIVIPDDQDQCNPDHEYFFSRISLRRAIEQCGMTVEIMEMRKRVPHESFIYCMARKITNQSVQTVV